MGAIGGLVGGAAGGLTGLIGHNQKQGEYNRQKQLAADIERNSYWTGMHGEMPKQAPNLAGDLVSGVVGGAMQGSGLGAAGGVGGLLGGGKNPAGLDPSAGEKQLGPENQGAFDAWLDTLLGRK